jgi:hypothetical protein
MKHTLLKPLWRHEKGEKIEIPDDKIDFAVRKGFIKLDPVEVKDKMDPVETKDKSKKPVKKQVKKPQKQEFLGHKDIK